MKTMFQLAWRHRGKVMREAGTYSRYYLRSLRDARGILETVDMAALDRLRDRYHGQSPVPQFTKYLNASVFVKVALACAYRLNLHRSAPKTVLDVGTGAGYFPLVCRHFGHDVTACDVNDDAVLNDITALLGVDRKPWRVTAFENGPSFGHRFDLVTAFQLGFDRSETDGKVVFWREKEWDFFLRDLAVNYLNPDGEVMLSGFNRKARPGDAVVRPFVEKGAAAEDGRIHFKSMKAFQ
jgi:SAM-dependent methyltransferase